MQLWIAAYSAYSGLFVKKKKRRNSNPSHRLVWRFLRDSHIRCTANQFRILAKRGCPVFSIISLFTFISAVPTHPKRSITMAGALPLVLPLLSIDESSPNMEILFGLPKAQPTLGITLEFL